MSETARLTRADLEHRKMENAMHVDFSRSESAWIGTCEGLPRLGVGKYRLKSGNVTKWSVDGKEVRDLDAALAVLNGEMTIEEAMAQPERQTQPQQKPRYSIGAQISEVDRELKMRRKVYPRLSFGTGQAFGRKAEADMALEIMEAVGKTLVWLQENEMHIKQRASY